MPTASLCYAGPCAGPTTKPPQSPLFRAVCPDAKDTTGACAPSFSATTTKLAALCHRYTGLAPETHQECTHCRLCDARHPAEQPTSQPASCPRLPACLHTSLHDQTAESNMSQTHFRATPARPYTVTDVSQNPETKRGNDGHVVATGDEATVHNASVRQACWWPSARGWIGAGGLSVSPVRPTQIAAATPTLPGEASSSSSRQPQSCHVTMAAWWREAHKASSCQQRAVQQTHVHLSRWTAAALLAAGSHTPDRETVGNVPAGVAIKKMNSPADQLNVWLQHNSCAQRTHPRQSLTLHPHQVIGCVS